jgi:hypothetical protein
MLKVKGTWVGAAAAVVAGVLLVAGMAVNTQSGAATDLFGGAPQGEFEVPVSSNPNPGNPPAAPIEPPADGGTVPGTNPVGGNAGAGAAPSGLPSAGVGDSATNSATSLMVLLGLAGVMLAGAGASVVAAKRSK